VQFLQTTETILSFLPELLGAPKPSHS
jgi:hypothetical protein